MPLSALKPKEPPLFEDLLFLAEGARQELRVKWLRIHLGPIERRFQKKIQWMWKEQGRLFIKYLGEAKYVSYIQEAKTAIPPEVMKTWEKAAEEATAKVLKDLQNDIVASMQVGASAALNDLGLPSSMSFIGFSPSHLSAQSSAQLMLANALGEVNKVSMERLHDAIYKNAAKSLPAIEKAVNKRIASWNAPTGKGPGLVRKRASLVTTSTIAQAKAKGQMAIAEQAKANGIEIEKQWVEGGGVACNKCQLAIDDGWVGVDEVFSANVTEPPAHVGCDCDLELRQKSDEVVDDEDEDHDPDADLPDPDEPVVHPTPSAGPPSPKIWDTPSPGTDPAAALSQYQTQMTPPPPVPQAHLPLGVSPARPISDFDALRPSTWKNFPESFQRQDFFARWRSPHYGSDYWGGGSTVGPLWHDAMRRAVRKYIGEGYHQMNRILRMGRIGKQSKVMLKHWDEVPAIPDNIVVWRGVRHHPDLDGFSLKELKDMEFIDKAFDSTSLNRSTATNFGGTHSPSSPDSALPFLFEIRLPNGTKMAIRGNISEEELIVKAGTKFKIISAERVTLPGTSWSGTERHVKHVVLEIIDQDFWKGKY